LTEEYSLLKGGTVQCAKNLLALWRNLACSFYMASHITRKYSSYPPSLGHQNSHIFSTATKKLKSPLVFLLSFIFFYHYTILLSTCPFEESTDFCYQCKVVRILATGADILPTARNGGEIYSQTEYCS
jgi:hypothetical protein